MYKCIYVYTLTYMYAAAVDKYHAWVHRLKSASYC